MSVAMDSDHLPKAMRCTADLHRRGPLRLTGIGLAVAQQREAQVRLVTGQRAPGGKIAAGLLATGYDEPTVETLKSLTTLWQGCASATISSSSQPNDSREEEQ